MRVGNSPPEGLFSRGGCHPCRVLAESEVVGEARCSSQDTWQPSSTFSVGPASPDNNGVVCRQEIDGRWRPRLNESLRFVPSRPVSSRPVSSRLVLARGHVRGGSRHAIAYQELEESRGVRESARVRSIDRSNRRDERSNERRPARERAKGSQRVLSFSFVLRSRGVRYRDSRTNILRRTSIGLG